MIPQMGIFKKPPSTPKLSSDDYLAAVFSTVGLTIGRSYETLCKESGLPSDEQYAHFGRSALLTWTVLLDSARLMFKDSQRYEVSKNLALTQGLSPSLREAFQGIGSLDIPGDLVDSKEVAELQRYIFGQQAHVFQRKSLSDLISSGRPFPEEIAYRLGEIGMGSMNEAILCYLCDRTGSWTADTQCTRETPHDWMEEEERWKTSVSENKFFTFTFGSIFSAYLVSIIRNFAISDYPKADAAMSASIKASELLALMAFLYKKLNSQNR